MTAKIEDTSAVVMPGDRPVLAWRDGRRIRVEAHVPADSGLTVRGREPVHFVGVFLTDEQAVELMTELAKVLAS